MQHFQQVFDALDVAPVLAELDAAPELWNAYRDRLHDNGPMGGTGDVWVRYFPRETLTEPAAYLREGRCEFYPAWHALPSIHPIAHSLMGLSSGVELGGILISRIPPGGAVLPHTDGAAWSARFYNKKFYVPLAGNEACVNWCEGEEVVMEPGTIWTFDNLKPHAVYNRGRTDRVTLIITLRSADA